MRPEAPSGSERWSSRGEAVICDLGFVLCDLKCTLWSVIKAISYYSGSETKNELDFRTAESNGENRIDDPCNETRIFILFFEQSSREKH